MLQQVKLTDRLGLFSSVISSLTHDTQVNNEQVMTDLSRRLMEVSETVSTRTQ